MSFFYNSFNISKINILNIKQSIVILLLLIVIRIISNLLLKKFIPELTKSYHYRRIILYILTIIGAFLIGKIWFNGRNIATFIGMTSAGLAVAMHDTIANIAGWFFIVFRRPFKVGDRIQIGDYSGDVIDMRFFQFSMIEIGNWVDADQSTGRIVHIPNNKVLREPIANYEIGFKYIWNEIPVLITFESDWKKAKQILTDIANCKTENLSDEVQEQIKKSSKKYLVFYQKLTPIVYTTVKDSGVLLTIRYLVKPRTRRTSEQILWEDILSRFANEKDINLAYSTTRIYLDNEKK